MAHEVGAIWEGKRKQDQWWEQGHWCQTLRIQKILSEPDERNMIDNYVKYGLIVGKNRQY